LICPAPINANKARITNIAKLSKINCDDMFFLHNNVVSGQPHP
jgi:hypothetical protein